MKEVLSWAFHIALAVAIGLLIVNFVVQRTIVDGESMEPTLHNNDNLWVEKISPKLGRLKYGDIVTVDVEDKVGAERSPLIKRVIAVAGDSIEIKFGKVLLNGEELKEDYILGNTTVANDPLYAKLTVPEGYIYVMGDNRMNSIDSRVIGPVEIKDISGKAVFRFLPFKNAGPLWNK